MTNGDTVVLAHRAECSGARSYEDLTSPFEAARIALQPLCAEMVDPEKVIPSLRFSAARAERCLFVVPVMDGKLTEKCKPGWTGTVPCARCVLERWREVLGGDPVFAGGPGLERLRVDEEIEGKDDALVEFVRRNAPRFSFQSSSPLAVTPVRFRFSGGAAALFLGEKLFVQSRSRILGEADIVLLLAVAPPRGGSDVSELAESDVAAFRAPNMPSANASRPDDGRPLLEDDGLYEPDWVADYLGIARGTLDNWVSQHKIPHTHVGGKLRFVGRALREWLESRTDRPDAEDDEADEEGGSIDKFPWDGKA